MIDVSFGNIKGHSPFSDQGKRIELLEKLNSIIGIEIQQDKIGSFPKFPLSVLQDDNALQRFFEVCACVIADSRKG
ncbi:MAG: hypothetical protein HQL96_08085 [Magnetococcales bacterium]|nr:hypothetical protein [Magnetococcales bacterium]